MCTETAIHSTLNNNYWEVGIEVKKNINKQHSQVMNLRDRQFFTSKILILESERQYSGYGV